MSGGLPQGWTVRNGGDVFETITSGSRGWAKHYAATGARFIRVQNVPRGHVQLDLSDVQHVCPPAGAEGQRTRLIPDDIVITITADLGRIGLVPADIGEAYVNQHVALARPRDRKSAPYLAWFLTSAGAQGQLGLLDRGATRAGLGLKDVASLQIPLPPPAEQRHIVARIEALFARTRRARADLLRVSHLADHLVAAGLRTEIDEVAGLSAHRVTLAQLVQPSAPIIYGILQPGPDIEGGIAYVRPTEIEGHQINLDALRRTTAEIAKRYHRSTLLEGDVILSIVGTIGKVAVVPRA